MRSFALATGSSGNSFYIESLQGTKILIDLGLPYSKLDLILEKKGVDIKTIDAVFITHEHSDHIAGLKTFALRVDCPIYISKGTFEEAASMKVKDASKNFKIVKHHDVFNVNEVKVLVLDKPHDAKESVAFVLNDGEKKLGVFTDLGHVTDEILHTLKTLDVVYFEANYCESFIKDKKNDFSSVYLNRLMSDFGHLSLNQCIDALVEVSHDFQKVVLTHISENTNSYENAYLQVKNALYGASKFPELVVGFQGEPTDWIE